MTTMAPDEPVLRTPARYSRAKVGIFLVGLLALGPAIKSWAQRSQRANVSVSGSSTGSPQSEPKTWPRAGRHANNNADWDAGNLVANGDFRRGAASGLPTGWSVVSPSSWLAPEFKLGVAPDGHRALLAQGNGKEQCFGYIRHLVHLEGGKTYRLRVEFRFEGMGDVNRHLVHAVFGKDGFNDGIFNYRRRGRVVIGSRRFPGPEKGEDAEVRLYFRFSPAGKVWWERVSLQQCAPIPKRLVKIACSWGKGDLHYWSQWLDQAGEKKVDVALLPEMFNGKSPKEAQPLNGPSGSLLASKAKEWHMYVSGTFYERRGHLAFNTAPLFDREGRLVGTYSKNELYDPEEDQGATPGTGLSVFNTDFGKVGIMICYDSWFPEVARLLAYKGAELVLFPNAGYDMELMPARAADNGIWIAASSQDCPAGIWDSGGAKAGEKVPDPTRSCATTISGYEKDNAARMLIATVDLSRRFSPNWWGGPMRSAPGGRRVRQTLIHPIETEIAREAKRWWTSDTTPGRGWGTPGAQSAMSDAQ
jgi:predicted amidohydrolase